MPRHVVYNNYTWVYQPYNIQKTEKPVKSKINCKSWIKGLKSSETREIMLKERCRCTPQHA